MILLVLLHLCISTVYGQTQGCVNNQWGAQHGVQAKVNNHLSLCAYSKSGLRKDLAAAACDNAAGYYLTSVYVQTLAGKPTSAEWTNAWNSAKSQWSEFQYVTTGQAVRDCDFSDWDTESLCIGWGMLGNDVNSLAWDQLTDGNDSGLRVFENADSIGKYSTPPNNVKRVSLCISPSNAGIPSWNILGGDIAVKPLLPGSLIGGSVCTKLGTVFGNVYWKCPIDLTQGSYITQACRKKGYQSPCYKPGSGYGGVWGNLEFDCLFGTSCHGYGPGCALPADYDQWRDKSLYDGLRDHFGPTPLEKTAHYFYTEDNPQYSLEACVRYNDLSCHASASDFQKTDFSAICFEGGILGPQGAYDCTAGQMWSEGRCQKCPAGSAQPYGGQTSCDQCTAGSYSIADRTQCYVCDAGTVPNPSQSGCDACPAGKYQGSSGQSTCLDHSTQANSPAGMGNLVAGSATSDVTFGACASDQFAPAGTACTLRTTLADCPAGKGAFVRGDAATDDSCNDCAADEFSLAGNECRTRVANACKAGTRFVEGNATTDNTCPACDVGTFSDADQALTCTAHQALSCPAGKLAVAGTPTADAKCEDCLAGTFALVGAASCTPHTKGSTCTNRQKLTPGDLTKDAECVTDTDLAPSEESGANILKTTLGAACQDRGFQDSVESPELTATEFSGNNLKITVEVDAFASMQTITFNDGLGASLAASVSGFVESGTANCQTTYVSNSIAWADYKDALKLYDAATAGSLEYRAEVVVTTAAPYDPAMTRADYAAADPKAWSGSNPRRRETRSVFQIIFFVPSTISVTATLKVDSPMPSPVGPDGPTTFDLPITLNDLPGGTDLLGTPHIDAVAEIIREILFGTKPDGAVAESERAASFDVKFEVTAPNNAELARVLGIVNNPDQLIKDIIAKLREKFPNLPAGVPTGNVQPVVVQADDVQLVDVRTTLNRDTLVLTTEMEILTRTAYPWKFDTPAVSNKATVPVVVTADANNANSCNLANAPTCFQLWIFTFTYSKDLCGAAVGETVEFQFAYVNDRATAANPYSGPAVNDVSSSIVLQSGLIQCAVQAGNVDLSSYISLATFEDTGFANAKSSFDIGTTAYFQVTVDTANLPGVTLSATTLKTVTTQQDGTCGAAACTAKSQYDVGASTPNVAGNVDTSVDDNADPLKTKFGLTLANNIFDMASFLAGGTVGLTINASITLAYQAAGRRRRRLLNLDPAQTLAKGKVLHKLYVKQPKHYGKTATICLDNKSKQSCKKASTAFKKMKFFAPVDGPCKWSKKKGRCQHREVVKKCADIRPRPKTQKQCETHTGCLAKIIGTKYRGCAGKFQG